MNSTVIWFVAWVLFAFAIMLRWSPSVESAMAVGFCNGVMLTLGQRIVSDFIRARTTRG